MKTDLDQYCFPDLDRYCSMEIHILTFDLEKATTGWLLTLFKCISNNASTMHMQGSLFQFLRVSDKLWSSLTIPDNMSYFEVLLTSISSSWCKCWLARGSNLTKNKNIEHSTTKNIVQLYSLPSDLQPLVILCWVKKTTHFTWNTLIQGRSYCKANRATCLSYFFRFCCFFLLNI